ncbi:hypothetical protein BDY21DRAFT_374052 [Lineolata rhizophorae]|uniref:Uncharacterized protein n=1 Tax=Lineolata rhizophorae TaxID=578093 RepID=A0A6A6NSP3_9PEZI|nr:hypothetical protein BDY21DRAFT_374052 [Lineolata rhizophorae]
MQFTKFVGVALAVIGLGTCNPIQPERSAPAEQNDLVNVGICASENYKDCLYYDIRVTNCLYLKSGTPDLKSVHILSKGAVCVGWVDALCGSGDNIVIPYPGNPRLDSMDIKSVSCSPAPGLVADGAKRDVANVKAVSHGADLARDTDEANKVGLVAVDICASRNYEDCLAYDVRVTHCLSLTDSNFAPRSVRIYEDGAICVAWVSNDCTGDTNLPVEAPGNPDLAQGDIKTIFRSFSCSPAPGDETIGIESFQAAVEARNDMPASEAEELDVEIIENPDPISPSADGAELEVEIGLCASTNYRDCLWHTIRVTNCLSITNGSLKSITIHTRGAVCVLSIDKTCGKGSILPIGWPGNPDLVKDGWDRRTQSVSCSPAPGASTVEET